MSSGEKVLVARTGRCQQRYAENGQRLVAGCIPVRHGFGGALEVMLVSGGEKSRDKSKGWIFPKGGWEEDETAEQAATRESVEEAGVRGAVTQDLGVFEFSSKSGSDCIARIFVLEVSEVLDAWPEQDKRHRIWCPPSEAVSRCKHSWMQDAIRLWISSEGETT